jgi:hypothetical protein
LVSKHTLTKGIGMVRSIAIGKRSPYNHFHILNETVVYRGVEINELNISYSPLLHEMKGALEAFLAYFNEYALEKGE